MSNPAPTPARPLVGRLLARALGLDARSLALLRIGLASAVLVDLSVRATDLRGFYSDDGVLPRTTLIEHQERWHFCLHLLGGDVTFQAALFGLAASAACMLALGLHTGAAAVACWLLTVSLQNRNPFVLSGADVLLRMALLWAMFLPLSQRFSLDALRRRSAAEASEVASVGTVAYTLQIVSVYVFAGVIKLAIPAWRRGEGLAYALRAPAFATAFGMRLSNERELLTWGSWFVPWLEIAGPLLLLSPWGVARLACVVVFWSFHAGIGLTLDVGTFSFVSAVVWSAFLPPWVWERALPAAWRKLPAGARRAGAERFARSETALRAFCERSFTRAAPPPGYAELSSGLHRGRALLCGALALYVLAWNVCYLREPTPLPMPSAVRFVGPLLRVDQRWEMFSEPITQGGWFVIPARLHSGAERELFSGARVVSWQRPAVISQTFRNDRWRKYMLSLTASGNDYLRMALGRSLCRRSMVQDAPSSQLEAFKIYWMETPVAPWDRVPQAPRKVLLWRHECRDGLLKRWDAQL